MSEIDLLENDPLLGDLTGPDFTGMSEEEIIDYWRNSTLSDRLKEVQRLRLLKWGRKALGPMDKTKFEIVSLDTTEAGGESPR